MPYSLTPGPEASLFLLLEGLLSADSGMKAILPDYCSEVFFFEYGFETDCPIEFI